MIWIRALRTHPSSSRSTQKRWSVRCVANELAKRLVRLVRPVFCATATAANWPTWKRIFQTIFTIKSKRICTTQLKCLCLRLNVGPGGVAHNWTRIFTRQNQIKCGFDWQVNNLTWTNLRPEFRCCLKTILICYRFVVAVDVVRSRHCNKDRDCRIEI